MASLSSRGRLRASALSVNHLKLRSGKTNRFKRLNSRVNEISEEQKNITAGQRQVREKFEAIEAECEQLRKETELIIKQNVRSQIASAQGQVREKFEAIEAECEQLRKETELLIKQNVRSQIASVLMSQILKAREAEYFNIVASLTKIFLLAVSFWLSECFL